MDRSRLVPGLALGFCLLLLLRGLLWGAPSPSRSDPVHLISDPPVMVQLTGRVLADARRWDESCSALLAVGWIDGRRHEGRTELVLRPCPTPPLQGWRVRVEGVLRRPSSSPHPLLSGSSERLAAQGSWSRLTTSRFELLARRWTPIADLRRRIAIRFL
ncbi:MAG: competence protein ComEC, partial [Synechococcus sp.]